MNPIRLKPNEHRLLIALAAFGFLVPNGVFLYFCVTDPGLIRAALQNPIALVFIAEAFLLMFLFAWLLHRAGTRKPGALVFIILSLLGSMAFSVPATVCLVFNPGKSR